MPPSMWFCQGGNGSLERVNRLSVATQPSFGKAGAKVHFPSGWSFQPLFSNVLLWRWNTHPRISLWRNVDHPLFMMACLTLDAGHDDLDADKVPIALSPLTQLFNIFMTSWRIIYSSHWCPGAALSGVCVAQYFPHLMLSSTHMTIRGTRYVMLPED